MRGKYGEDTAKSWEGSRGGGGGQGGQGGQGEGCQPCGASAVKIAEHNSFNMSLLDKVNVDKK